MENFMTNAASYPWIKSYPPGLDWAQDIPVRPVYEILDQTVRDYGDRPGMDFMGKKQKWGDLGDQVNRMAKGLQGMGVGKGTRVGLFLPNCPFYLISYYAILKAGGTVVNLNPLYAKKELMHLVEDSSAEIVVTANLAMLYDKIHEVLHETNLRKLVMCRFASALPFPKSILFPLVKRKDIAKIQHAGEQIWFDDLLNNDGRPTPVAIDPHEDIAVLQYTGGTTGVPKGAMLTHANISANVEQSAMWFPGKKPGEEKMLGVLPFFHVFAMTAVMNMSVRNAFELITIPRFELDATLKLIASHKPHYFPAVPAIYNAINNHPKLADFDLKSLRYCVSGGAPLPVEVKKTFEKNTGCVVVEGYGLTESSPVVCANPIVGENKPGSIGMPLPGTVVEIIDAEDKTTRVKPGERGELCVRGPQVMKGYLNKPDDSASVLKDGVLYTGDVAIMDDEGYVFIVDRIKDMIITNGYKVYPRNVEEAIYQHTAVEECIVAGIKDESRGEIVKAWVKPKAGQSVSSDALKDFLKDKISPMEIPRQVEIRTEPLPKTMIGKLSRKDILEQEAAKKA
ncbi:MAG: long-chain fatty acid--CoA ligase [Alphaproteobacteria bacterium]|nr:long-chain fatty acid--CoA ligase [Alphaproteobacteria bacterium]MBU0858375.1 long-chain fatty acid--CoA ligase [Alphaproteobacteria bacterium]